MELPMDSAMTTMATAGETEEAEDLLVLAESPGIIPFFPSIMALQPDSAEFNASQCICSDLQHEDYSPLYAWFNYIVIIIMLPSLSAFGVVTNLVNVFVYSRPRMRNSSNTYLLFLACSDFFVVLTGLFIFWIDSARSYIPQLVQAPYTTVYTLPFGYMAQSCSIYFTVAAAFDCYVCVCWRRKSKQHCTVSRARRIVGAIALLSVVYNSLRFPQFNLRKCIHDGSGEMIVEICPTSLFFRINTAYNVYLYMIVMTLFPFSVLLLLNLLIVCRKSIDANRQRQQKKKSTSSIASSVPTTTANGSLAGSRRSNREIVQQSGSINAQSKSSHIAAALLAGPHAQFPNLPKAVNSGSDETITMIMVVVLFLCCNTLALVVNLIETFFEPDALLLNLLSDASNFLVIFNSSVNCVIYLIFNSEYREVFLAHFVHFKGRCYPFHLLQCLFECHGTNSRGPKMHHQSKNVGNGSLIVSASPSIGGGGMPTNSFCYSEKALASRFRQLESVNATGEGTPKSLVTGPESPIWLQCPCTAISSPPNSHGSNNHFCHRHRHHHYCPCWAAAPNIGEWAAISAVNHQKGMAMFGAGDDFESERDSGCGDENCSSHTNQQQQRHSHRNSSMSTSPMRGGSAAAHHQGHSLQSTNCYLAEVKMMMGSGNGNEMLAMPSPPHIYVRPLLSAGTSSSRNRLKEEWMMRMRNGGGRNGNGNGFGEQQFEFMDDEILIDADGGDFPVTAL